MPMWKLNMTEEDHRRNLEESRQERRRRALSLREEAVRCVQAAELIEQQLGVEQDHKNEPISDAQRQRVIGAVMEMWEPGAKHTLQCVVETIKRVK